MGCVPLFTVDSFFKYTLYSFPLGVEARDSVGLHWLWLVIPSWNPCLVCLYTARNLSFSSSSVVGQWVVMAVGKNSQAVCYFDQQWIFSTGQCDWQRIYTRDFVYILFKLKYFVMMCAYLFTFSFFFGMSNKRFQCTSYSFQRGWWISGGLSKHLVPSTLECHKGGALLKEMWPGLVQDRVGVHAWCPIFLSHPGCMSG